MNDLSQVSHLYDFSPFPECYFGGLKHIFYIKMTGQMSAIICFFPQFVFFDGFKEVSYLHMPYHNYIIDMPFLLCDSFDEL